MWFQSQERPRNNEKWDFGFYHAKNGTGATPTPSRSFAHPIFMRSLTLIPCSLLQNYKETIAMQASTLMKLHTALVVLIF